MAINKLPKTGYTEKTSKNYVINAGTIFTNLTHSTEGGFVGEPHGATAGGVKVNIEIEYRDVEVDGTGHMKVKGNKILQSASATVTANMKEITAETVRRALNGTVEEADGVEAPVGYQVVRNKRKVEDGDYLDNIAVVGILSGSDEPVIVILDNALCISGFEGEMTDDSEMVIEQVYEAHADHTQLNADEFPWKIMFPTIA